MRAHAHQQPVGSLAWLTKGTGRGKGMIDLSLFQCAPYAVRTGAPMARHRHCCGAVSPPTTPPRASSHFRQSRPLTVRIVQRTRLILAPREMLEKTLSEDGFGVLSAASGEEGIRLLGATLLTRALV